MSLCREVRFRSVLEGREIIALVLVGYSSDLGLLPKGEVTYGVRCVPALHAVRYFPGSW
jgi:hypothetical protein